MQGTSGDIQSIRDIQQYFGKCLNESPWDRYKRVDVQDEFPFIQSKILFAFYGPPIIQKDQNEASNNSYTEGYSDAQIQFMTPIYETICKQIKYSPCRNNICMSTIYVSMLPGHAHLDVKDQYTMKSADIINTPVFKVRKCIKTEKNNSKPSCSIYIDENCRVYSNWHDYLNNNKLDKGVMFSPVNGRYQFKDDESSIDIRYCLTPKSKLSGRASDALEKVSTFTALGSLGILGAALTFPVSAPLVVGATIASTTTAAYSVISSGNKIADRIKHEQTVKLSDPQARGCWINLIGSTAGVLSAGTAKGLTMASKSGMLISKKIQTTANIIIYASIGTSAAGIGNGVYTIIDNYANHGTKPSKMEILQLTSSIFFFYHSTINIKTASKIIEETQNSTINEQRDGLRSNRHRKMFDKMAAETRRQAGGTQQGNAEVIRSMQHIDNKDDFFASALRMNKEFNANKVKVSFATDGSMNLNAGSVVNPKDLINLNPADRAEFLSNVKELNLRAKNYSTAPIKTDISFNFSYASTTFLVKCLTTSGPLKNFIMKHLSDLLGDNLMQLKTIVKYMIDKLNPHLMELLECNAYDPFHAAFEFTYKCLKMITGEKGIYKCFSEALESHFMDGKIIKEVVEFTLTSFESHIRSDFQRNLSGKTCKDCGGICYSS